MILLNSLYSVTNQVNEAGSVKASIVIRKDHVIFKGHFPGTPIVPGVCMMQMVKEILEVHTGSKLFITEADNIKFLSMLDPERNSVVELSISYQFEHNTYQIAASLLAGQLTFFKLRATLQSAA